MTTYKPTSRCPICKRCPNVRFSEDEVRRAKRERQGAHVMSVACPSCGTRYWVHARDIAAATKEPAEKKAKSKKGVDTPTGPAVA